MKNPICISTGCIRIREEVPLNEAISIARKFEPDGIEISLALPSHLYQDIFKNQIDYLKESENTSIHAPFKDVIYEDSSLVNGFLNELANTADSLDARNVVFHAKTIRDLELLTRYDLRASIENEDSKGIYNNTDKLKKIFDKKDDLDFTFDFAHALSISPKHVPEYLEKFDSRLSEIHLSYLNPETKAHDFLHKYNNPEIRDALSFLKNHQNVPLVLEGVARDKSELLLIQKEIDFLRIF